MLRIEREANHWYEMILLTSGKAFVLREYAYFDRQKIEDFLSTIENGLPKETTEITEETDSGVKGKLGIPGIVNIEGAIGQKGDRREQLKAATDASLFQRLHRVLTESKELRRLSTVDENTWNDIQEKEILELVGNVEPSSMQLLLEMFERLIPLMKAQKGDLRHRRDTDVFRAMSPHRDQAIVKIVLQDERYNFVASLPKSKMRVTLQELSAKYEVLCRVQRKLRKDETFDLFSLVPGVKLPTEIIKGLVQTMPANLESLIDKRIRMEDFRISYPAAVVTPIAIYR